MLKNAKNIFAVVAVLACVAVASAQGGGRGQGGRGRGNQNSLVALAMRADVQKDVGITDEQKTKLTELQTKLRPQRGQGGGGGGQQQDPEARQKAAAERAAAEEKGIAEILDAKQVTRLGEISIQIQGPRAILNPKVQKSLGLTDDQVAKIKEINTKFQEASRALMQKMRDGEIQQEDMRAATTKNTKALGEELTKVLTDAQSAKLKELGGKPFEADKPTNG